MMHTIFFFSKSRTTQDNSGHFGDFCRTILTLNEGQCRTISKKITENTREYRDPVHAPIKKTKVTSIARTLHSYQRQTR